MLRTRDWLAVAILGAADYTFAIFRAVGMLGGLIRRLACILAQRWRVDFRRLHFLFDSLIFDFGSGFRRRGWRFVRTIIIRRSGGVGR
jgi:hypothetical protein